MGTLHERKKISIRLFFVRINRSENFLQFIVVMCGNSFF